MKMALRMKRFIKVSMSAPLLPKEMVLELMLCDRSLAYDEGRYSLAQLLLLPPLEAVPRTIAIGQHAAI